MAERGGVNPSPAFQSFHSALQPVLVGVSCMSCGAIFSAAFQRALGTLQSRFSPCRGLPFWQTALIKEPWESACRVQGKMR